MKVRFNKLFTTTSLFLGIVASTHLQAQENFRVWDGSDSDNWADANNWEGGVVPTDSTADTASIRQGTPGVTNRTVLHNGTTSSIDRVFLGQDNVQGGAHLTVQSGASLTSRRQINVTGDATLVNNGAITAGTQLQAGGTSSVRIGNGGSLNGNLTATSGSMVRIENGGSMTGNLLASRHVDSGLSAKVTIDGTLNGNFEIGSSTAEQRIGATGKVFGDVKVSSNDVLTIAGEVSGGQFSVNNTGKVVIESTATILSEGPDAWLYGSADVTWNVGADGSVGTLRTNHLESTTGAFDGEWRYTGSASMTVVLDDYDATNGLTISLALVSGIQNETTFASNVLFLLNGENVSSDFTYANGIFTGNVVPEPGAYALLAGCLGLAAALTRRARRRSSAPPR